MRHSASMLRESIDHHCIPLSKGSVMRSFDLFCFSSSLGLISCWINKRPYCWWLETSWRILCFDSWGDSSMIFTRDFVTRENRQLVTKIGIHGSPYIIIYISHESSSTNDIMAKKRSPPPTLGWCGRSGAAAHWRTLLELSAQLDLASTYAFHVQSERNLPRHKIMLNYA